MCWCGVGVYVVCVIRVSCFSVWYVGFVCVVLYVCNVCDVHVCYIVLNVSSGSALASPLVAEASPCDAHARACPPSRKWPLD